LSDKIKQIIKLGIFISLSAVLLYLAFRNISLLEVLKELKSANYLWVLLALIASVIAFVSRARRWILLIRPLGYEPGIKSAYHSVMTGYLFNFAAPRLGELTRCVALGRKEKIPVDKLFGTVIAERAFDLLSMFIILVVMVFARGDLMDSFLRENILRPIGDKISSAFGFSSAFIIILIVFHIVMFIMLIKYRERLMKIKAFAKIGDIMKGIFNGLKSFLKMKDKLEFIIHTVILWSCYTVMAWVIFYALPSTSHLNFSDAVFILVIGTLGMSAPVQGGIGAFHWIVSRGLNVVYDIDLKDGLAYATLSHESQLLLIAILGTISFFLILGKSRKSYVESVQED